ncbi:unnamed protein product [Sphagnum compactum]
MRSLLQPMRFYVQYEAVKKNDDEGNDAAVPQDQKNVVLKLLMNHHAKEAFFHECVCYHVFVEVHEKKAILLLSPHANLPFPMAREIV